MNVKYIDTVCTNTQHIIFNASLLAMLGKFYPNITFYGEKNNMIDRVLSNFKDVNKKRQKIYVSRAIQILDDIDEKYKDYQIIENFCLGEIFKTYKSSGYEFLKEKYNNKKTKKLDILYQDCPYDNK